MVEFVFLVLNRNLLSFFAVGPISLQRIIPRMLWRSFVFFVLEINLKKAEVLSLISFFIIGGQSADASR